MNTFACISMVPDSGSSLLLMPIMIFCAQNDEYLLLRQVRLSSEDLRMMVDEASKKSTEGIGKVDLKTFIDIIKNSAW